jgi:hypothetical protein
MCHERSCLLLNSVPRHSRIGNRVRLRRSGGQGLRKSRLPATVCILQIGKIWQFNEKESVLTKKFANLSLPFHAISGMAAAMFPTSSVRTYWMVLMRCETATSVGRDLTNCL